MKITVRSALTMPILAKCQTGNLIFDDGRTRVWSSRLTVEDGARINHGLDIEEMQGGQWETISEGELSWEC